MNRSSPKNKFIVIEGPDGAGKTTIRDFIYQHLKMQGYRVLMVGQHSWLDVKTTRQIVDFREQRSETNSKEISEAYFRDKRLHAFNTILPALESFHVISDRYIFSDAVYHDVLFQKPAKETILAHHFASTPFPDAVLFISTSGEEAYRRILSRKKDQRFYEIEKTLSRISEVYWSTFRDEDLLHILPEVITFNNDSESWERSVEIDLIPRLLNLLQS